MTAKSDELVEELVSACVAFGREKEPDWQTRIEMARCALKAHIEELEAENAELKERVAMLDVTAFYKSLGEMGYIEQVDKLNARIAELEAAQTNARELVGMTPPPEVQE